MITPDNQASWDSTVQFYESLVIKPHYLFLSPLLRLVQTIAASERATKFRAGHAMTNLIVSLTPYHGLKRRDPFVSVRVNLENNAVKGFQIEYYKAAKNFFTSVRLVEQWVCEGDALLSTFDVVLERLWEDTKGTTNE